MINIVAQLQGQIWIFWCFHILEKNKNRNAETELKIKNYSKLCVTTLGIAHRLLCCACVSQGLRGFWPTKTQRLKRATMLRLLPLLRRWERTIQNTQNPPSTTSQKNTGIMSSPSFGPWADLFKGPASCVHQNRTVYSVNNAERNRKKSILWGSSPNIIECGRRTLCMPNHWLQRSPCGTGRVSITLACDVQAFTVRTGEGENRRVLWCTLSRASAEGCCEQRERWQCRWKCLGLKKELGKKKEVNKTDGEKC